MFKAYLGLLVGFVIVYLILDNQEDDDQDGPGGGLMQPAYSTNQWLYLRKISWGIFLSITFSK